jgi:hypothetical protein
MLDISQALSPRLGDFRIYFIQSHIGNTVFFCNAAGAFQSSDARILIFFCNAHAEWKALFHNHKLSLFFVENNANTILQTDASEVAIL